MAEASALPRPQPVGIFPLPAGYLLIGPEVVNDEVRLALVEGRRPAAFPPTLRYYELALAGDLAGALDELRGSDVLTAINRFVLDPSAHALAELRSATDGHLRAHLELVAFSVGLNPDPPDPAVTDGEFAAMAHVARATSHLERHDRAAAIDELETGAQAAHPVSRALGGLILGQLANVQLDEGGKQRATVTFEAAIDALTGTDLNTSLADLHVTFGAMYQEMSEAAPRLMRSAIDHYMAALQLIDATTAPESFAIANSNLGLAYLMSPMHEASDLLRIGIAVQSMRDALKVFTAESHPERWSTTQLNLANALVYMPSKHQAENIAEAVQLYEDVLQSRDRQRDPQGRARVLANQGNALAHLGHFDQAKARLHEARAIFEEFADDDAVRTVRSILDEVAKQESIIRQDRPS